MTKRPVTVSFIAGHDPGYCTDSITPDGPSLLMFSVSGKYVLIYEDKWNAMTPDERTAWLKEQFPEKP